MNEMEVSFALAKLTCEAVMNMPRVDFSVPEAHFELFLPLLRQGVTVLARDGQALQELLTRDLGLSQEMIQSRVQTVFFNGHPVDDLQATTLEEGAVLSLSAAMPGLLGACMRVDSPYASMRDSISQGRPTEEKSRVETATIGVILKLFNFMAREIGPCVLSRGVVLEPERVLELVGRATEDGLWEAGLSMTVDEQSVNPVHDPLAARFASWKRVFVQVRS